MSQLIYFVFIGFKNSGGRLELYRVLYSNVPVQVQYFTRAVYGYSTASCVQYCTYTVLYCTILYCTILYCTVLYCTIPYCTVLYCTILYCTVLYLYRYYSTSLYNDSNIVEITRFRLQYTTEPVCTTLNPYIILHATPSLWIINTC